LVIEKVEWGQGGNNPAIAAEQQILMRLWISSPTAWSGVISVKYPQDATQNAQFVMQGATTPGVAVPLEFPICLPRTAGEIAIDATDGKRGQSWKISDRNRQFSDFMMPARDFASRAVLIVGATSAQRWSTRANPARPDVVGGQSPAGVSDEDLDRAMLTDMAMVSFQDASRLSSRWWSAYDAYDAVIVEEGALLKSPRAAQAALLEWVRAGGRMIVVMSAASNQWSQCLPSGTPLPLVAADAHVLSPGASVVDAATRAYLPDVLKAARRIPSLRDAPARRLKLTPDGLASGWKVAWQAKDAGLNEGWLAYGPVEFGMVGFLGVDPDALQPLGESTLLTSSQILWRDVFKKVIWPDGLGGDRADAMSMGWWITPSAPTIAARESLRRLLDEMVVIVPIGSGVFTAVFVSMLALAFLVGPFDAVVLKRLKMRHRSYLTALAWIGIAAVVTWRIPTMVRSGSTAYSHLVVEDVLVEVDGRQVRSVREGLLGVFAGRPGDYPIPEHASGAMWRGVTAIPDGGSSFKISSPLELTTQELESGVLGHQMRPLKVAQWAFRSAQYQEPVRSEEDRMTATVRRDDFGLTVTLRDVPAGASFVMGTLELGGKYFALTVDESKASVGSRELALTVSAGRDVAMVCLDEFAPTTSDATYPGWMYSPPGGPTTAGTFLTHRISTAFSLWKPSRRERAIEARLATGEYACVYVRMKDCPIPGVESLESESQSVQKGIRLSRITVPFDDALASETPADNGETK
jgi:hypothetical protein